MEFTALTPEAAREVWPKVEKYIDAALKRTGCDAYYWPIDVFFDIARQQAMLWVAHEDKQIFGVIVTKLEHYPRMLCCRIAYIGGWQMKRWIGLAEKKLDEYGIACGCKRMVAGGRDGWGRVSNYEKRGVVFAKEL